MTIEDKIDATAEQIEQSIEFGCLTKEHLRLILKQFTDEAVKKLNLSVVRHSLRQEDLKAGDTIVFDRVMSKYIEVGKKYQVLYVSQDFEKWYGSFEIMLENNKTKRMKRHTQSYNWRIVDCG